MVVASTRRSEAMRAATATVRSRIRSQPMEPPAFGPDGTANVCEGRLWPPARTSRLSSVAWMDLAVPEVLAAAAARRTPLEAGPPARGVTAAGPHGRPGPPPGG